MDNRSSFSTQDCSQDGFMDVPVDVGSEYLKYKIIPDGFDDFSWAVAQKKCEDEGATMWEVMNEEEWDTIYEILKEKRRKIIWINGKSKAECTGDPEKVGRSLFWKDEKQNVTLNQALFRKKHTYTQNNQFILHLSPPNLTTP